MPTPLKTYGKRAASSLNNSLKRKDTSDIPLNDGGVTSDSRRASQAAGKANGLPEKRRRLEKPDNEATLSATGRSTKLSMRMLSRSKTESSVDSPNNSPTRETRRVPSLPTIPSPSKQELVKSKGELPTARPPPAPLASTSAILTRTNSTGTSKVTRTYAGKSRSFLVPLATMPAGSTAGTTAEGAGDELEEDLARESYASLRERWGVDDSSEEDPFYDVTASRSGASTPISHTPSPTKHGRGHHYTPPNKASRLKASPSKQRLVAPPLPSNMMNPLKSITELRNKGESRRFLDEVAYLLDGMATSSSPGLIKSSALELVTKLAEPDFSRKAKAADVYGRVYDLLVEAGAGAGTDKVLDTLLLTFLALLAREPTSLKEVAEKYSPSETNTSSEGGKGKGKAPLKSRCVVDILFDLLSRTRDEDSALPTDPLVLSSSDAFGDAHYKRAGIGKKEKGMIRTMHKTLSSISKTDIDTLSTPSVAASLLHALPPSLLPCQKWRVSIMMASLNHYLHQALAGTTSTEWTSIIIHLRLLDLHLLGQWGVTGGERVDDERENEHQEHMVDELLKLANALVRGQSQANPWDGDEVQCLDALLRVLVTITHGNPALAMRLVKPSTDTLSWVTVLVKTSGETAGVLAKPNAAKSGRKRKRREPDLLESEEETEGDITDRDSDSDANGQLRGPRVEPRTRALDRLCLALALLTNLVHTVGGDVGDRIGESGALAALMGVYNQQVELSSSNRITPHNSGIPDIQELEQMQADASFLCGHLAVLFGLLMRGSEDTKEATLELLPRRGQSWRSKLDSLLEQAKRFVSYFDVVQSAHHNEELNEEERGEKKVAQEIVSFLERLRDEI